MSSGGNRVQKSNGKIYWYGAGTEILDETDLAGNLTNEYIYFGGKRIARRDSSGNIYYYMEDFLGSSRVITTAAGSVCYDADFYPYGGERAYTNTCQQNYKFEGKERDAETGNDNFGARYYSSSAGRWLSADWSAIPAPVPYANFTNPQTLNLYAMVHDNPETFADLDGHDGAERDAIRNMSDRGGIPIGGDSSPLNPESVTQQLQEQQINLLTVTQVGNIVFNETQSLSNSGKENVPLDQARDTIAHTIINTDVLYGSDRQKIAKTAPSVVSDKAIKANPEAYRSSQEAARRAYAEWKKGIDPTRESIRFNLRKNASRANFQRIQPIKTQSGPYNNSFPSSLLPSTGVYVNTYGPPE